VATHPSDMCVALAALEAVVHVEGPAGKRQIPFADFHRLPEHNPERDKALAALYFSALDIGLTHRDKLRFLRAYFQRPLRQVLKDEAALLAWLERKAQKLYDRKQRYGDAL